MALLVQTLEQFTSFSFSTMEQKPPALVTPPGITKVIRIGNKYAIGLIDDEKVLKFWPRDVQEDEFEEQASNDARYCLDIESKLLQVLGSHQNIIGYYGVDSLGVYLEYTPLGSVLDYLESSNPTIEQRLLWARQTAAAVAHCHKKRVIHCGLHPKNVLLDSKLNVKLSNFRGRLLGPDGKVALDGDNCERLKFRSQRVPVDAANEQTDLFALGTTMYCIITDHEPFPEFTELEDADEIVHRWSKEVFPFLQPALGGTVILKCWKGLYKSADAVVTDLDKLMQG